MKTHQLCIVVLFTTTLFSQACSPIYYSPNTQNVPLLSGKGDHSVAVSGNDTRIEIQGAYAAGEHFGLGLDAGFVRQKDDEEGDGGKGKFGEVQAGYFQNFSEHFIFETYVLLGFGTVENHFPSTITANPTTNGKIESNLLRVGLQPAIGYRSRFFEAALSARLVNLNFSNARGSLIFEQIAQTTYLENNKSLWLIEPALTLRGGTDMLKLQIQANLSANLTNKDFQQDNGQLTIGLVYRPRR